MYCQVPEKDFYISTKFQVLQKNLKGRLQHCTKTVLNKKIQALSWGKDMVAMSGSGRGYMQTIIITPYVHNMIYHVPQMMKKHGSLRRFSGQGIFINLYEQVHGTREIESPALP